MTKTKDELIAELTLEAHSSLRDMNVAQAFNYGIYVAVSRVHDHRQKEIDEQFDLGYERGKASANRWWAERWQAYCGAIGPDDNGEIAQELDAAAARVMEVKV